NPSQPRTAPAPPGTPTSPPASTALRPHFLSSPQSRTPSADETASVSPASDLPKLQQPPRGCRLVCKSEPPSTLLTPDQRLLLLEVGQRRGLPVRDFAALVGIGQNTLSAWNRQVETVAPEGLMDRPKGAPAAAAFLWELAAQATLRAAVT